MQNRKCFFIFFLPCFLLWSFKIVQNEKKFDNECFTLLIPKNWVIVEKNNNEDSRWLVSTLSPKGSKQYLKESFESTSQNIIIVAKDSISAHQNGTRNLRDFAKTYHEYQKEKYNKIGSLETTILNDKVCYSWERKIEIESKKSLIQKIYLVKTGDFYVSIITTYNEIGKTSDLNKMLSSIKFKK